jgi:hypothetical protein
MTCPSTEKKASKAFGIRSDGLYGQSFYLALKQAIDLSRMPGIRVPTSASTTS